MARRVLAGFLVLAAVLAACTGTKLPVEPSWDLVIPASGGVSELPVRVVDETGTVKLAELAGDRRPDIPGFGAAESVDGDRTRLLIGWIGGACDTSAELRYRREGAEWRVVVSISRELLGACPAVGILRAVIVDLANGLQVDPATVTVSGS